jgi:hypothetical protein
VRDFSHTFDVFDFSLETKWPEDQRPTTANREVPTAAGAPVVP